MFVRVKSSGDRKYLQIVESRREGKKVRQRVIATLGRLDHLRAQGHLDGVVRSLVRFSEKLEVVEAHAAGTLEARSVVKIGPGLIFGRLWEQTGIQEVLNALLSDRGFTFPVERAVFLTVVHRIFVSGSDRQAHKWVRDVHFEGIEAVSLHHLYRAMAWLGTTREQIEEHLFARRRDLFSALEMVFFDTTSLYFEGEGGEGLGQRGYSRDHRPDLPQMIVGAVLDQTGRPICCPMWPGNRTDVTVLLPTIDRLRLRFGVQDVVVVADRGMLSQDTVLALERRKLHYSLGAKLRRQKEVTEEVLSRAGRYQKVTDTLWVKEVWVEKRRYVVCFNPEEAQRDALVRQVLLEHLEAQLSKGAKTLVGNRGYRRYLKVDKEAVAVDHKKVEQEARYDGKYVLRTNTSLPSEAVATRYKELWRVERLFRTAKSSLDTRPIFHHFDATIQGHVFVSFLALVLMRELEERLEAGGIALEWPDLLRDIEALYEVEVLHHGCPFRLRSPLQGSCGKVFQAVGVAVPPSLRRG